MTRDCEKLSILLMFRCSEGHGKYQKYILEQFWTFKSDVSKDFPARYLWSKKTFTACHLTISLERSRVVRKRSF